MISIRPDENNGLRLFIGQEQFARFVEDKQAGEIRLDTEAPQKHLTSFEMRMLARREQQTIFSRDEINGLAHSTDLHTHFAGCLSPEDLIEAGLEHNISIPADLLKKAGIDLSRYKTDGHNNVLLNDLAANRADIEKYAMAMRIPLEQQETFNKMEEIYVMRGPFTKNAEMFPTFSCAKSRLLMRLPALNMPNSRFLRLSAISGCWKPCIRNCRRLNAIQAAKCVFGGDVAPFGQGMESG